jgi:pilus assembly protein CpaE
MTQLVLASADVTFEDRVRDAFEGELGGQLRYWRDGLLDDPSRMLTDLSGLPTQVVAIGPDLPCASALALARALDQERPEIGVVIVAEPSATLLREALQAGARDVIAPETPKEALRAALERAIASSSKRRAALERDESTDVAPRRVISVLCPKGGVGKTTLSSNLAIGLGEAAPGDVVVVDLDLQFGDVASALALTPEQSIADATRSLDTLDSTSLKAYLTRHPKDFYVLCAPLTPIEADELESKHVEKVLELLTDSFRYVLIDTPSGLDEATLTALEFTTDIVLLSATDVPSVRSTRKEIDALAVIGRPEQHWHFVLNRADARTGLTIGAIEAAVGVSVDVAIPSSRSVPLSLNKGEPLLESDPRSPVSLAIAQLVHRLAGRHRAAVAERAPPQTNLTMTDIPSTEQGVR